jgi:RND superfamily putative drug exporter
VTLVPALCGLAGYRLLRSPERAAFSARNPIAGRHIKRQRQSGRHRAFAVRTTATLTARWATQIGRRPWRWALGSLVTLLLLAAPVVNMRTWPQDAGVQPESNTSRRAYDLIAAEYGPGANGPLLLAVDTQRESSADIAGLISRIGAEPGVAAVTPPILSGTGDAALIVVQPATGPQDQATQQLIERLRTEVLPPGVLATGLTAFYADVSAHLASRLWVVIAFVVCLSLLLLTTIFRSLVVAIKAAVMNLLSISAAYGVMVAVFQWGWGAVPLGLPYAVPVSSWVPVLMFTILFGLSMDYQVFLLSRVREDWLATGDAHGSVIRGLTSTGRVITSAAAIMVAVFIGFAFDGDSTVKMMGFGMAVAVFIDASIVRMVLVPATMSLLGTANWWLPAWLDRLLPTFDIDKSYPTKTVERVTGEAIPDVALHVPQHRPAEVNA